MKVYYLTLEGISSTVFESQVWGFKKRLEQQNIQVKLIIGQKLKARVKLKKLLSLIKNPEVKFILLPETVNHLKTAQKTALLFKNETNIILHCRNTEAAYVGILVKELLPDKTVQVLYDVRGYVEGEADFFNKPIKKKLYEKLNDKLFKSDIYFNFVSKELFDIYNQKYSVPLDKSIFCNSAYDDVIFQFISKEKEAQNTPPRVLYVGGNQSYQKIDEIISAFLKRKDVELTVVTSKKIQKKATTANIQFKHGLTPSQINNLASSFDYGIIYRDNQLFNQIATPTKISEYWGKGLKVIAINSAGAYTNLIKQNKKLGIYIESIDKIETIQLSKVLEDNQHYIAQYAKENLSQTANLKKYLSHYKKMLKPQ